MNALPTIHIPGREILLIRPPKNFHSHFTLNFLSFLGEKVSLLVLAKVVKEHHGNMCFIDGFE